MMHPRLKYYPWSANYTGMRMEFRPFVMFMNPANYRSAAVNTDRLGFRLQYDPWGNLLDLDKLGSYQACDVFIGNSTAFGVDVSSDQATVADALSRLRCKPQDKYVPIINLSVRGATLQQEIATFLIARKLLPPVRNIISVTGVMEAMYCIMHRAIFHPDFGTVNNETGFFEDMTREYINDPDPFNRWLRFLHGWLDNRLYQSTVARYLFRQYCKVTRFDERLPLTGAAPPPAEKDVKRETVLARLGNDLDIWSAVARGTGARMHYVLQPVIGWTRKPLSATEKKIMVVDRINIPSLARYANQQFYGHYSAEVRRFCQSAQIDFHDANPWFDSSDCAGRSLFTDVCHMSDEGSRVLAQFLDSHLRWNDRTGGETDARVAMDVR